MDYIKRLESATKSVFPNSKVHFIMPFSAISGLSELYLTHLREAIVAAGVGWRIHIPPSMKDKLARPRYLHLTHPGRQCFIKWLQKLFAPNKAPLAVPPTHVPSSCNHAHANPGTPAPQSNNRPDSYAQVAGRPDSYAQVAGDTGTPDRVCLPRSPAYNGLAREIAEAFTQMLQPWRRDPLQHTNRHPLQWPPY